MVAYVGIMFESHLPLGGAQVEVNVHALPRESRCFWSAKAALEEPKLLQQVAFATHLEQLQRVFSAERLRAVHQAGI